MRRFRFFYAIVGFLVYSGLLNAAPEASGPGSSGVLVPREVFVGDTAEFSFGLGSIAALGLSDSIDSGDSVGEGNDLSRDFIAVPAEDIPESSDATVESIVVSRVGDVATVTIRFVPWVSGVLELPQFAIHGTRVTPPTVRIASAVEKTGRTSLEPARPPLLVPGTMWLLYAMIACALAGVAVCAFAIVHLARYALTDPLSRHARSRFRLFSRELKILERRVGRIGFSPWYAALSFALRRYLGAFCAGNAESFLPLTGSEIAESVRDRADALMHAICRVQGDEMANGAEFSHRDPSLGMGATPITDRVRALFAAMDMIRFSGSDPQDQRIEDIARARALASDLEDFAARAEKAGRYAARVSRAGGEASHVQP